VLRRTGFGASGAEVDAAQVLGVDAYVRGLFTANPTTDPGVKSTPVPTFTPIAALGASASKAERQQRNQAVQAQLLTLTSWWVRRMVAVERPFPEKLAFCWHNHFATAATKVRQPAWLAAQNTTFRRLGQGDFRALALAMLTDAAMLDWLDGEQNTASAPNENLSREFMELFTLGEGAGYTETDVREGARALTGWRIARDGTTSLNARQHDSKSKTVLGVTGNLDQAGFCDAVLADAASPRHLATRWWGQLVSDTAPTAAVVQRLVAAYGSGRSMSAMLQAQLQAPEFQAAAGSIVVNPVEWVIGAARALKVPVSTDAQAKRLIIVLRELGQVPFYPPNVSGWPSGQAWLSSAAADTRLQTAMTLVKSADISAVTDSAPGARVDAAAHLLGVPGWSARTAAALTAAPDPNRLLALALNAPEYLTN
jgi:uncharacterized protein (DUF1800 family)